VTARPGGVEVVVDGVSKSFENGRIRALRDVSFRLEPGDVVSLTGPSGGGKSTLLNLIGALDRSDSGSIVVGGERLERLENPSEYRAATVGFVFQFHHLLPEFSAVENVAMLGWIGRVDREEALHRASSLLSELGLDSRARHFPNQLSGGEQQRVAIARALLTNPQVFLADEPTGNLDLETSERVFDLMRECHRKRGLTSVIVTHNPELASRCDRIFEMKQR